MLLVVLLHLSMLLKKCGKRNLFIKHFFWTCEVFQNCHMLTTMLEKWLFNGNIKKGKALIGFPYFYPRSSWLLQWRPLVVMSPKIHYLTLMLSLGQTSASSLKHQIRYWLDKWLLLPVNPLSVSQLSVFLLCLRFLTVSQATTLTNQPHRRLVFQSVQYLSPGLWLVQWQIKVRTHATLSSVIFLPAHLWSTLPLPDLCLKPVFLNYVHAPDELSPPIPR